MCYADFWEIEMTLDEYNKLKSISATLSNAFAQNELFWMREIMAQGMNSLDALVNSGAKQHPETDTSTMRACPLCNPTGVFNYSPLKDCPCGGKAWLPCDA